ncbi:MAG: helix-turn-helix domain-containing protein [Microthrixaceae bacterium]|jgi:AcrR family transcriptional regulator|nr:TetR/AcrR family transcriptional regulator [Actinomycetota bacterium]
MAATEIATRQTGTSDRLLTAAVAAFNEHGVDNVTLDDIATRAGVHRVTLHRNFPGGREQLILDVLHREVMEVDGKVAEAIAVAPDAAAALLDAITVVFDAMRSTGTLRSIVADPSARSALHGPAASALHELGVGLWRLVSERAANEGRPTTDAPDAEIVDYVIRLGTSLVAEPGPYRTVAQARGFFERFVVPMLLPPRNEA